MVRITKEDVNGFRERYWNVTQIPKEIFRKLAGLQPDDPIGADPISTEGITVDPDAMEELTRLRDALWVLRMNISDQFQWLEATRGNLLRLLRLVLIRRRLIPQSEYVTLF